MISTVLVSLHEGKTLQHLHHLVFSFWNLRNKYGTYFVIKHKIDYRFLLWMLSACSSPEYVRISL